MVHRILVGKRFKQFSPRSEGSAWPENRGNSLNFHQYAPASQLLAFSGPQHAGCMAGGNVFGALPLSVVHGPAALS